MSYFAALAAELAAAGIDPADVDVTRVTEYMTRHRQEDFLSACRAIYAPITIHETGHTITRCIRCRSCGQPCSIIHDLDISACCRGGVEIR